LWAFLDRRLPSLRIGEIAFSASRTLGASVVAAALAYGVAIVTERWGFSKHLPGLFAGIAFAAVFLLAARLSKSPEFAALLHPLRRRKGPPR
jgi:hypothetical protein